MSPEFAEPQREKPERALNVDDPDTDAQYLDEPPEHAPPCDDCGEREAEHHIQCPVDDDLRLDLCWECYEDRGPGITVCHVKHDANWEINGGRASPNIKGGEKRHLNNAAYPGPGWLGNPYPVEDHSIEARQESLKRYRWDLITKLQDEPVFAAQLGRLRGKRVACWCRPAGERPRPHNACHLDIVNAALLGLYQDMFD